MTILFILLAVILFFMNLFLTLRVGSDYPVWPLLVIGAVGVVVYIFLRPNADTPHAAILLSPLFAQKISNGIAIKILKKRAGNLIVTYKGNTGSSIFNLLFITWIFYISLAGFFENGTTYEEPYFWIDVSNRVVFALLGIIILPGIFHKGECLEKGIVTPDFQYYPWSGYESYKWMENREKKIDERFSLKLEGGKNYSYTIDNLSDQEKNILEELFAAKLKKIPKPQN